MGKSEGTVDHPKHVVVVGCLVRNNEDAILLIRNPRRGWEMPQGRVEEGEDLLEAAHREVFEETGTLVDLGPLAAVYSKVSPPPAIIFNFLASYRSGELRTSDESLELGWFAGEEALRLVNHPVNLDRLKTLLRFSGKVLYRVYTSSPFQLLRESIW